MISPPDGGTPEGVPDAPGDGAWLPPGGGLTADGRLALESGLPELKPRAREIADAALELLDADGVDGISMRRIAARLGVRAPSLYKHLPDKQAVLDILVADILRVQGDVLRRAVVDAEDPLGSLFSSFRTWALANPRRYTLTMAQPLSDDPMVRAADLYSGDPLRWLMRDDLEGAVTAWAFAHGTVDLEIKGRIPPDLSPTLVWDRGISRLRRPDDPVVSPPDPVVSPEAIVGREELETLEPLTPRATEIVSVARALLEEEGLEALSMRRIAARLGVRAPSLYKHFPDKRALQNAILAVVLRQQGDAVIAAFERAAGSGVRPIETAMFEYRRLALEYPGVYRLNMSGPLDRGPMVRSAELHGSAQAYYAAGNDALAGFTCWSFAHGMVDLELNGRFPADRDIEAVWRRGLATLVPPGTVPDDPGR